MGKTFELKSRGVRLDKKVRYKYTGEGGGGFRIEETHIWLWPIHTNVWQKTSQYCKVITSY